MRSRRAGLLLTVALLGAAARGRACPPYCHAPDGPIRGPLDEEREARACDGVARMYGSDLLELAVPARWGLRRWLRAVHDAPRSLRAAWEARRAASEYRARANTARGLGP